MPNSTVQIPPPNANPQTISPAGGQFSINVTQTCSVQFGSPTVPNTFPDLAGKSFPSWSVGSKGPYGIPPDVNDELPYSYTLGTAGGGVAAPMTGHVIIVGTNITGGNVARKKKGKKAPAKKKAAVKKGASKPAAKRKPAKKLRRRRRRRLPGKRQRRV